MIEILINYIEWNVCEPQAAAMHTSGGIRVEVWGKRKRFQKFGTFSVGRDRFELPKP